MWILRRALGLRKIGVRACLAILDPRVPNRLKLLFGAVLVFILSPLNLLGDIPLLGIVDDAGLIGLALMWFTRVARPYQQTIDG